ncbi:MAG: glycoside hydrolase family 97 catalytic domain-containing protein [Ilumatobacter sp.]
MNGARSIRHAAVVVVGALAAAACSGDERTTPILDDAPVDEFVGDTWTTAHDGGLEIEVGLLDGGSVAYRVTAGAPADTAEVVVDTSLIGLETSAGSLGSGLVLTEATDPTPWTDTYDLPTGKERSSTVDGTLRSLRFSSDAAAVDLVVDTLVTEYAVAFRTSVVDDGDGPATEQVTVGFERTSFSLDPSSTSWMQPHDRPSRFGPAYERIHGAGRPIAAPSPSTQGWNLPLLAVDGERWTMLAEAGLTAAWAGSHISAESADGELFLTLPDEREGNGVGSSTPSGPLPLTSPWRVILSSTDVGDIVETTLVRHLSAPADDRDWSWVEPGRVSWSWWSDPDSPKSPDRLIDFVDLAGELEWEYSLVDANWNEMTNEQFATVIESAASNDVGLFLWYNSGGPNNTVTEAPRNRMFDRDTRRAEMERISELGIRGIKVDFFHSDKPAVIGQYLDILADAADFELLVNFHGSTIPRGWGRTWPNLMTMEAVAGGEQYLFNPSFPTIAPPQNVVLAFTRNVVGPMDYTPTMLQDGRARRTTDAHELALAVVYESALTHFIDTPETYLSQPDEVVAFLRDVPTVWDEVEFLDGSPDSHVAIARRHGEDWWIGAINGTGESVTVDMSAMSELTDSSLSLICDGVAPADGAVFTMGTIPAAELDELRLAPFGGCVLQTR